MVENLKLMNQYDLYLRGPPGGGTIAPPGPPGWPDWNGLALIFPAWYAAARKIIIKGFIACVRNCNQENISEHQMS